MLERGILNSQKRCDMLEIGTLCQTIHEDVTQIGGGRSNNQMVNIHKGSIVLILKYDKTRHLCNVISTSGLGWIWPKNLRQM